MNVFDLFAKISLDTSEYEKGLSDSGGILDSFSSKFTNVLKDLSAKFFAFGKDCVSTGMDFDKAMSQVAATMGTTTEQIGDLRDFAREMGANTAFSATEAAEALNYMALAGYNSAEAMEMLPNVLNLAAAGNMDLARASDMVTDSQTALGLSFDETKILVDQMAKTASSSNTSVEQLGDAILTVGANAKGMKGGTLELVTLLGKLADNGIKGSEAGTKLRNMLSALPGKTDAAADALKELGVSLYDKNGNMRKINDVLQELDKATRNMTQERRDSIISTIFNARDLAAAKSLIDSAADAYDDLEAKVMDSSGAAGKMADEQLNNLAGDITIMQSALSELKITVSDLISPYLRNGVQTFTTEIGNFIGAFKANGIKGVATMFRLEWESIKHSFVDPFTEFLTGNTPELVQGTVKFVGNLAEKLTNPNNLSEVRKIGFKLLDGLIEGLTAESTIDDFLESAPKVIGNFAEGIKKFLIGDKDEGHGGLIGAASKLVDKIGEYLAKEENRRKVYKAAEDILKTLGGALIDCAEVLLPFIGKLAAVLAKLLVDSVTDALQWVVNPSGAIADANNPYEVPSDYLEKYNLNERTWLSVEDQYKADTNYSAALQAYEDTRSGTSGDYATYWDRKAAEEDLISAYARKYGVNIPGYADGTIVTKPTLAVIGERYEPEAVVPLNHETETSRALGLGGGITISFGDIYVNGTQNAGTEVVRQIDEALRIWQIQQKRGIGGVSWQT